MIKRPTTYHSGVIRSCVVRIVWYTHIIYTYISILSGDEYDVIIHIYTYILHFALRSMNEPAASNHSSFSLSLSLLRARRWIWSSNGWTSPRQSQVSRQWWSREPRMNPWEWYCWSYIKASAGPTKFHSGNLKMKLEVSLSIRMNHTHNFQAQVSKALATCFFRS